MDVLTLLAEAHAAGLVIWRNGDQVEVSGPKPAAAIVRQLMERKPEVVAALRRQQRFGLLWDHLRPGERRILDVAGGREWSEFLDGSIREWAPTDPAAHSKNVMRGIQNRELEADHMVFLTKCALAHEKVNRGCDSTCDSVQLRLAQ